MALQLQPTLGEVRSSVLARCGLATQGNVPRNIQAILDERIRSAQRQLYELYPWLQTFVSREIPLVADTTDYDVPDDTDPGHIQFVSVRRLEDGKLYELEPFYTPTEPNTIVETTEGGLPLRYNFIDQIMRIQPKPDVTEYDALVLWYNQTVPAFIEDSERAVVDGEALIQLSEILVKNHFGGQDTDALERSLERYVDRKRSRQSDGAGFQMGGRRSFRGMPDRRNRFHGGMLRASYGDAWRPW